MSRGTSIFLTLLVSLGWAWFCHYWYTCLLMHSCYGCGDTRTEQMDSRLTENQAIDYTPSFDWSMAEPKLPANFDSIKQVLASGFSGDKYLIITGKHYEGETLPTGTTNLGIARGVNVKKLLSPPIPAERMLVGSRKYASFSGDKNSAFPGVNLKWVNGPRTGLDFVWSDPNPFLTEGYDKIRNDLLAQMNDNNEFEIVGLYYEGEETPEGFENMGLARAAKLKDLFVPPIPEERVILRARLMDKTEGIEERLFSGAVFSWTEGERKTVEELADRIIIRFPFNSTERDYDKSVEEYIKKLANRIKETGEEVTLTGHTDNVGSHEANVELGLRRAQTIRDNLVKLGVNTNQIKTNSLGETQPVASNDTEAGRHDNRRVVVRLIIN